LLLLLLAAAAAADDVTATAPLPQVFGEITSAANVDYETVARQVCHDIGYNHDVSADVHNLDGMSDDVSAVDYN
jgi:S-adenosylmethionine synthetase